MNLNDLAPAPDAAAACKGTRAMTTVPVAPIDFATCDFCDVHKDGQTLRVLPPVFKDFGARQRSCGPVSTALVGTWNWRM